MEKLDGRRSRGAYYLRSSGDKQSVRRWCFLCIRCSPVPHEAEQSAQNRRKAPTMGKDLRRVYHCWNRLPRWIRAIHPLAGTPQEPITSATFCTAYTLGRYRQWRDEKRGFIENVENDKVYLKVLESARMIAGREQENDGRVREAVLASHTRNLILGNPD